MTADIETAFITGAASGIGLALAKRLAADGVSLYLTDINKDALSDVQSAFKAYGNRVHVKVLDVADRQAFHAAADDALETLGHVDAVFNNAGVSLTDPIEHMSDADMQWLMDINFWGVVTGTKAFLAHMKARGKGHIVNMSSILGHISIPSQSLYCAAKHAVKAFTEALDHELQGTGVSVHAVHPGGVDTGIVKHGRHRNTLDGAVDTNAFAQRFKDTVVHTSADAAAEQILDGIARGKFHILVGPDARRMYLISRLFPRWFHKQLARRGIG